MKWFGMASLAMASESEQCYSSRGPIAASLCQKPSCFNWKTEKFTKLRCARKMIWVHMGFHGFLFFSKPFCSFYMFSYQNSYFAHDLKGSAQDAMLTPPGHVTKIAQHSRQNAYRSTKRRRQHCNCNICNTTVNAIQHPVLDTIGGIPNRIPLARHHSITQRWQLLDETMAIHPIYVHACLLSIRSSV